MKVKRCGIFKLFLTVGLISITFAEESENIMDCLLEKNSLTCAKKQIEKEVDRIELEVSGRKSEVPMSKVIEEAGSLVADGLDVVFDTSDDIQINEEFEENRGIEEARRKKFGKKKKAIQKLFMLGMLLKSKLSLLLQLLTAHFQIKFFIIAVLGLVINAARFWLDLKKSYHPSKVIYYEHAQHQHHYDHEDDHGGYWGRAYDEDPQKLAYSAYAPDH